MKNVMGIDLGTQSIKVIIYNPEQKKIICTATSALDLISAEDGSREQLSSWWIQALSDCMHQLPVQMKSTVCALGVSGQQHGFVPLNRAGDVLAPVKLWCDTSTVVECNEIISAAGGESSIREMTGNALAVGFTASKILWLKKHRPDAYAQLHTVLLPHDYLNFYFTGRKIMECGDASGTGVFDIRARQWSAQLIAAIDNDRDLLSCFPPLLDAVAPVGFLLPNVAKDFGLPADVIVSAGGGDNMMAAIGTGNVCEGRLTASMGTSGTLFAYTKNPVVDDSGCIASFCSSTGGWLPLVCTMNCTVATEQLRQLFDIDVQRLDELAKTVAPGANGVLTLPFYNGERTPALPNAKAVIYGLDLENTCRENFIRSAMESAVLGLKTGLNAFERNHLVFSEVVLTGGAASSTVWCEIVANVLNLPVRVLSYSENAVFGAALQALWCYQHQYGEKETLNDICRVHLNEEQCATYCPDKNMVAAYEQIYQQYDRLLAAVSPLYSQ